MNSNHAPRAVDSNSLEFEQMLIITCSRDENVFRIVRPHLAMNAGVFVHPLHMTLYRAIEGMCGECLDKGQKFPTMQAARDQIEVWLWFLAASPKHDITELAVTQSMDVYVTLNARYADESVVPFVTAGLQHWLMLRGLCTPSPPHVYSFDATSAPTKPGDSIVRIPTGFLPLDRALGGGFGKGYGNLILGASGVGKSVLAAQLSFDMCCQDAAYQGLLIHTEMTELEYRRRVISNKCRVPYERLKDGFNPSIFTTAEQKERYERLLENFKRWQIRKWELPPGFPLLKNLEDLIKRFEDEQGKLDHVHLDQLSGIVKPLFAPDYSSTREIYHRASETVAAFAQEHNLAVTVYAQAHPEKGIDQRRVTPEMAAECKTLHLPMATAIGISGIRLPETSVSNQNATFEERQWLYLGKSRKSDGGLVPFRRRFDFMRIEPVDFYAELPVKSGHLGQGHDANHCRANYCRGGFALMAIVTSAFKPGLRTHVLVRMKWLLDEKQRAVPICINAWPATGNMGWNSERGHCAGYS